MNDQDLSDLLGEAPKAPDAAFRIDVFARVAARERRRAAYIRAVRTVTAFTAIGVFFPLARAAGFTIADAQPLIYAAAVVWLTYVLAREAVRGSRSALARSFAGLRLR